MRKLNSKNKLLILGLSIFTFLVLSAVCVFIIFKIKDIAYIDKEKNIIYNKTRKNRMKYVQHSVLDNEKRGFTK